MSRARARRSQRKPTRASRRPKKVRARVAKKVRVPRPTTAELRLLALAQELAELARNGGGSQALSAVLEKLAAAYGPTAPLPREVFRAWVQSRTDKTATLALAWAREQVRLGLQEVVERTMKGARGRVDVDAETFAWFLLAGCEAIRNAAPAPSVTRLTWTEARWARAKTASSRVRRPVSARGIRTVDAQTSIVTMSPQSAVASSGRRRPSFPQITWIAEAARAIALSANPHW